MAKSAISKLQERPLSPDHFKTFSRCAKKYELQFIQRLNWPADQRNFELGKSVHKLMEYQARALYMGHMMAGTTAEVQAIWQKLSSHAASRWPIVASEWAFSVPLYAEASQELLLLAQAFQETAPAAQKYWLGGRIDRISWQPETQTLWVLDWKTGTAAPKQPESDWQTRIYLWAVLNAYEALRASILDEPLQAQLPVKISAEQVRFLYLEVSVKDPAQPIKELQVSCDAQKYQLFAQAISQQLQRLMTHAQSNHFPLPPSCPDMYCPYNPICGIQDKMQDATLNTEFII